MNLRRWIVFGVISALVPVVLTGRSLSGSSNVGTAMAKGPPSPHEEPSQFRDVSAIIEGEVSETRYEYSDTLGPRTISKLKDVVVHRGEAPDKMEISQLGGPLPDGSIISVSELDVLHPGSRYVFFVGPPSWFYTPIWSGLTFKVERFDDGEIVLGPDGRQVTEVTPTGVDVGATVVADVLNARDPSLPVARSAAFSRAADVRGAIPKAAFVGRAADAVVHAGGRFSKPIMSPAARVDWRVHPTIVAR